jgi:branched-chain amino acid transport system permease protein
MSLRASLLAPSRWRPWEIAAWVVLWALPLTLGSQAGLINEIAILALFAISLDLILGYAGIVSLGHAAFFGVGAYAAGLFAKHVMPDPLVGLLVAMAASALLGLLTSPMIVRGSDLTRLMVTMGVALVLYELANKFDGLTGGADGLQGVVIGPLLGRFEFDLGARVAQCLFDGRAVHRLHRAAPHRALTIRHVAAGAARQPAAAGRDRLSVNGRLAAVYTLSAALAGAAGALLAQTTSFRLARRLRLPPQR